MSTSKDPLGEDGVPPAAPSPAPPEPAAPASSPPATAGAVAGQIVGSLWGGVRAFGGALGGAAEGLRAVLTNVVMAALALLGLAVVYEQFRPDVLYVDPVPVPAACKDKETNGLDRVGHRLASEMSRLQRLTGSARTAGPIVRFRSEVSEAKLGEVSVRDVVQFLRGALPYVGGHAVTGAFECVPTPAGGTQCDAGCPTSVQLRLDLDNGEIVRTKPYVLADPIVDQMVAEAAAGVLQAIDPCAFAQIQLVVWSPDASDADTQAQTLARAEAAAARCVELTADRPEPHRAALTRWAQVLEHNEYVGEAAELYAAATGTQSVDDLLRIADQQARQRELAEAETTLRQAVTAARGNQVALARIELARGLIAYDRSGGTDGATQLQYARRWYATALRRLETLATASPDLRAQIEVNLGNALRDEGEAAGGDPAAALEHFRKAILDAPRAAYAHNGLGRTYEAMARKAADRMDNAEDAEKRNEAQAERLDALRNARRAFMLATELDPSFWEAENNLARVYAELGEFDAARRHHADAAIDGPRHGYVYVDWTKTLVKAAMHAEGQHKCGLLDEAKKHLEKAGELVEATNRYLAEADAMLKDAQRACPPQAAAS